MSKELIIRFYKAFQDGNGETMASMYHADAVFSDEVFQNLNASEAGAMWKMLIERSKGNLKIEFHSIEEKEGSATGIWEANYLFGKTGRKVHNVIRSQMKFKEGKVINHQDRFHFWKWTQMALGIPGILLGWTPMMKNKVRAMARKELNDYMNKNQIMTKIYHNPRCSTSRKTLQLLEDKGEIIDTVEYLTSPPTKDELIEIINMLGIPPIELIRKGEEEFKEHFKGKDLTDEEWIQAMVDFPKLIERPIVIKDGKAELGRPPEKILDIL